MVKYIIIKMMDKDVVFDKMNEMAQYVAITTLENYSSEYYNVFIHANEICFEKVKPYNIKELVSSINIKIRDFILHHGPTLHAGVSFDIYVFMHADGTIGCGINRTIENPLWEKKFSIAVVDIDKED